MLPYKRYLLPQIAELSGVYLDNDGMSYRRACCVAGVPLAHADPVADANSSEASKEQELTRRMSAMTVHRFISYLVILVPFLHQLNVRDLRLPVNISSWHVPSWKYRSSRRRDHLICAKEILPCCAMIKKYPAFDTRSSFP